MDFFRLPCLNHPEKRTRRRCSICWNPICSTCSIRGFGRFYCSQKCVVTDLLRMIRYPFRREHLFKPIPISTIRPIDILLILFLLFDLFLFWVLWDRYWNPNRQVARLSTPLVSQPEKEEIVVHTATYTIQGKVKEGTYITLIRGDSLYSIRRIQGNEFTFPEIPLITDQNKFRIIAQDLNGFTSLPVDLIIHYKPFILTGWSRDIQRGSLEEKKLALTFDGGSESNVTRQILDTLRERKLRVTIFLTGHYIERFPDLVHQMVADGHEIGNHTWSHPHLTAYKKGNLQVTLPGVNSQFLEYQLKQTSELFEKVTGARMAPYWRAPFGEHNMEIRVWAAQFGYTHISWTSEGGWKNNMDSMDWVSNQDDRTYLTAEQIMEKILSFGNGTLSGKNGAIVLMHLGTGRENDALYSRIPEIIDKLTEQGYQIVSITDLLRSSLVVR